MVSDGNKTRILSMQETLLLAQFAVLIRQCIGGWHLVRFPSMCCKGAQLLFAFGS